MFQPIENEKLMKAIGDRVKTLREQLGISQEELGRRLGYKGRSAIYNIESGRSWIPRNKVFAFATELNTTVESLMGGVSYEEYKAQSKLEQKARIVFDLSDYDYETKEALTNELQIVQKCIDKKNLNGYRILDYRDISTSSVAIVDNIITSTLNQFKKKTNEE